MIPPTQLDITTALANVETLLLRSADAAHHERLRRMAHDVLASGGKRLRPRIMLLSFAACGGERIPPALLDAAAGMELIHAATLVHDDVIDRAAKRRGRPSAAGEHGADRAIVAGDFLFVQGFALSARQDAEVVRLTAQACTRLAEGELTELDAAFDADLDLERYLDIIDGKTAAPLEACGRIGAHLAGRDDLQDALGAFGHHLGMAFQVTDDLLDLRGDPAVTGKPRGTDLRSGAPNAVVMLGLGNGARAKLTGILGKRARTDEDVQTAIDALLHSDAVPKAEELAEEHARLAAGALDVLPPSAARRELLAMVQALPKRST